MAEKYHRWTNDDIATLPDSVPVGENDSGSHDSRLPDSGSLDFGSYDQMYCLIGQAGYLQQTAGFKVSRVLIEVDGDDWTIMLSGAEKDGIPAELRMARQKIPCRSATTCKTNRGRHD